MLLKLGQLLLPIRGPCEVDLLSDVRCLSMYCTYFHVPGEATDAIVAYVTHVTNPEVLHGFGDANPSVLGCSE